MLTTSFMVIVHYFHRNTKDGHNGRRRITARKNIPASQHILTTRKWTADRIVIQKKWCYVLHFLVTVNFFSIITMCDMIIFLLQVIL